MPRQKRKSQQASKDEKPTKKRKLNPFQSFNSLPLDLWSCVFEFLDCFSLFLTERVCQAWCQAAQKYGQFLWKKMALDRCESLENVPQFEPNWKAFVVLRLLSEKELRKIKWYYLQDNICKALFDESDNEGTIAHQLEGMHWVKFDHSKLRFAKNCDDVIEFMSNVSTFWLLLSECGSTMWH